MNNDTFTSSRDGARAGVLSNFWQLLNSKRISYLTLPLIVMATVVEFVILATGWKYQQVVCLPQGMGVSFFGIGPIGATILAVETLKLPLAIWTASRTGWAKGFMLMIGLPLICVLTFQLVKDMAVYEMGVAMTPASQMLEKATDADTKVAQLKGELMGINVKKLDRTVKLAELAARKAKAKAELDESLRLNGESRQDAISMTDYQKQQLSEVEARQATVIKQADADSAQLTKAIAELRAQRETEVGRASQWNAEEARLENDFKVRMADYANKRAAYEKDLAAYNSANFVKRQLMKEPINPGVAPVREDNTVLKPTAIAEIDAQIKAKEAELAAVNAKRRERVARIEDDAHKLREQFDTRSSAKREEADHKREALLVAQANLDKQYAEEEKQINQDFAAAAQKIDGIQAQIDASAKAAESFYQQREEAIKKTQVFRIATTVEIVRGLLFGQRPVTIKATAKERGDLYTDQISMVRIWVYPVLAFIVAFLPTLMVEIGFSTLFKPEQKRVAHRLGFFGRRMHWLYIRAGRQKILRAERLASEASAQIAIRDRALATATADAEKALAEKEVELQAARESADAASVQHANELAQKEGEWVTKFSDLAESLNRAIAEKDAMRDFQKSEIERQVQARQNAWAERITQLRQELDTQRAASEAERTAMLSDHQKKLIEITEDCKTQVIQARRQMADTELAAVEASARLSHDLKEALHARDMAEAQLKQQSDAMTMRLAQAKEDAGREVEKAVRNEKQRADRMQMEFEKSMRQREEDFERRLRQREQELAAAHDLEIAEAKAAVEDVASRREMELERQLETRVREIDARWKQDVDKREESARIKLQQREQQLQAQAETRFNEMRAQAEEELRRQQAEAERQLNAQSHDADARLVQELQQKEMIYHARLKQREMELAAKAAAREAELQNQWSADMRAREDKWQRQADARVQAVEAMSTQDAQQRDEMFQAKMRQRDQEWQTKLETVRGELRSQSAEELRRRESEAAEARSRDLKDLETQLRKSIEDKHAAALTESRKREQDLAVRLTAQTEAAQKLEKERDEAKQLAFEKRRQVHDLNNKLAQVSLLIGGLNGSGNGSAASLAVATVSRNS
jgi:hypothetical protein